MGCCEFVELIGVIKGHGVNARSGCCADEGDGFAWIGEDDARRIDGALTDGEDLVDFAVGSTVKTGAERSQESNDIGIWVTLDS